VITLVDTHAHLNHEDFEQDLDEVLERAMGWGVRRVVVPGFDRVSSERAVQLASRPMILAAVGIHPHDAGTLSADDLDWFRSQLQEGRAVAVGEIGLDYYRELSPREKQQEAFRAQVRLAREVGRPIIVHNREAGEDVLRILCEEGAAETGCVLHCFSEDVRYEERAIELGCYIGIAGPVTYKSSKSLQEVARTVPLDRLLVETDAPYIPPQPFRGRRSEPAHVRLVAEKIAELRSIPLEEVALATTQNADRLFGLFVRGEEVRGD